MCAIIKPPFKFCIVFNGVLLAKFGFFLFIHSSLLVITHKHTIKKTTKDAQFSSVSKFLKSESDNNTHVRVTICTCHFKANYETNKSRQQKRRQGTRNWSTIFAKWNVRAPISYCWQIAANQIYKYCTQRYKSNIFICTWLKMDIDLFNSTLTLTLTLCVEDCLFLCVHWLTVELVASMLTWHMPARVLTHSYIIWLCVSESHIWNRFKLFDESL